jgi:acetyl-CoA/propionyl-CoA carboxylase biotin carboxyl carrier protein
VLTSFDVEIGQNVPAGTPLRHIDVAEGDAAAAADATTENTEEA